MPKSLGSFGWEMDFVGLPGFHGKDVQYTTLNKLHD